MRSSSDSYRPSNGSEGRAFEAYFCARCIHDHQAHLGNFEDGCLIWARSLGCHLGDEEYPAELIYGDDGQGMCTKYEPDGC